MNAFHSIWSKPKFSDSYSPEYFDILTAVLSALLWRKHNGKISMVCDSPVADFLYSNKLYSAWDEILVSLDYVSPSINPKNYWAAGKLFALSMFSAPIVGIDTDFLVWKKLEFNMPLMVIHKEDLEKSCYPDLQEFKEFSPFLDFSVKASNTAFFYIGNNDFLKLYTDTAIKFMGFYNPDSISLPSMLFAEQRLFSMCAKKLNIEITELSPLSDLFSQKNRTFTHLWGYKENLRKNPDLNHSYCEQCLKHISSISYQLYEHLLKLQ